ncbi:hypothetical protein D3C73_853630 [compost metagenome]
MSQDKQSMINANYRAAFSRQPIQVYPWPHYFHMPDPSERSSAPRVLEQGQQLRTSSNLVPGEFENVENYREKQKPLTFMGGL